MEVVSREVVKRRSGRGRGDAIWEVLWCWVF